jgi:hypothetical protein
MPVCFLIAVRGRAHRVRNLPSEPRPGVRRRRHLRRLHRRRRLRARRQGAVRVRGARVRELRRLLPGRRPECACPWAPCYCPDPGCDAFTSPARLLDHFRAYHPSWPVPNVNYGKPCRIPLLHVLVCEKDRSVFLVTSSAIGLGLGKFVSMVCVRARPTEMRRRAWSSSGARSGPGGLQESGAWHRSRSWFPAAIFPAALQRRSRTTSWR